MLFVKTPVSLCFIVVFSFHLGLTFVFSPGHPTGTDGYYVLKQIESIASGQFYFEDHSLAFFLPALFTLFFKAHSLAILQVITSLCYAASVAIVYGLTFFLSQNRVNAIAAALFTGLSLPVLFFSLSFYKNLFGVMLFLGAVLLFLQSGRDKTPGNKEIFFGFVALAGALLSHKSAFLLSGAFGLSWLLHSFSLRRLAAVAAGAALLTALFFLIFSKAGLYLNALLSSFDGGGSFLEWLASTKRYNVPLFIIWLFSLGSIFVYAIYYKQIAPIGRIYGTGVVLFLASALFPFQKFSFNEPSVRMLIMAPFLFSPLLFSLPVFSRRRGVFAAAIAVSGLPVFLWNSDHITASFPRWNKGENVAQISQYVKPDEHLIAHHGLNFFIDYHTGIRARQWQSENPSVQKFRVAYVHERLFDKGEKTEFVKGALLSLGENYCLVSEAYWLDWKTNRLMFHSGFNPEIQRPAHLHD